MVTRHFVFYMGVNSIRADNLSLLVPSILNKKEANEKKKKQGWRSGESTRLPPMWPGFDSRNRRHKWVEFVLVLFSASRAFLWVLRFPPSPKIIIQLIPAGCKLCSKVTHGPYSGCQRRLCKLSVRPCLSCVVAVLCDGD